LQREWIQLCQQVAALYCGARFGYPAQATVYAGGQLGVIQALDGTGNIHRRYFV